MILGYKEREKNICWRTNGKVNKSKKIRNKETKD